MEGGEGVDEGESVPEEGYESSCYIEVDELDEVVAKEGEDGGEGGFSDVEKELPFGFSSSSGRRVLRRWFWEGVPPEDEKLREVKLDEAGSESHERTDESPRDLNLDGRDLDVVLSGSFEEGDS